MLEEFHLMTYESHFMTERPRVATLLNECSFSIMGRS